MGETESDLFERCGAAGRVVTSAHAVTIVMRTDDLTMPPSCHVLSDVDVVWFARGKRQAIRDRVDGLARLLLQIPDPVMSADHGRLLRVQGRWLLEDPGSKNGAVIAGRASRCGMVELGDLFELGHTVFLLDTVTRSADMSRDVTASAVHGRPELVSLHPELVLAAERIAQLARTGIPVLLHGQTGTGKELYARAVHELSERTGPFVAVNCGALSPGLLEAELFGHRHGAFAGAADRLGFVRSADRGTLFLDGIDELSPPGQVALLRVLEERQVVPVGDSQPVSVDLRVCAASQRALAGEVEAGRFRNDLYARLLGCELRLPPLRDRRFDVGHLAGQLVARLAPRRPVALAPAAARALVAYDWPRNVRELERCLATALVLSGDRPIDREHLPEAVQLAAVHGRIQPASGTAPVHVEGSRASGDGDRDGDDILPNQLAAKLIEHGGNLSAVARDLGKHREQIRRWIQRFGFDVALFRR